MKIESYKTTICGERPEYPDIKDGEIYYAKDDGIVCFNCPCGCGTFVQLPVEKSMGSPNWDMLICKDMTSSITLRPSIKQVGGCNSHYFVEDGKVRWC